MFSGTGWSIWSSRSDTITLTFPTEIQVVSSLTEQRKAVIFSGLLSTITTTFWRAITHSALYLNDFWNRGIFLSFRFSWDTGLRALLWFWYLSMYPLSSWVNLLNLQILAWHDVSECAKSPGCLCKLLFQMAVNNTVVGLTYSSTCHTCTFYGSRWIKQPALCEHCSASTIEEMRTKKLTGQWLTALDRVFGAIRWASPESLISNSRAMACNSVTFARFMSKIRVLPQFPARAVWAKSFTTLFIIMQIPSTSGTSCRSGNRIPWARVGWKVFF